jgi:hypothetical protein
VANLIFTNFTKLCADGTIDWDNGAHTYRMLLTTSSYSPDVDAHLYVTSVTNELSGGSYARKDLANRTVTKDDANNRSEYGADNVAFTALTNGQTATKAVIYKFGTGDADSPLIACLDINTGTGVVMTGDVTLKLNNGASTGGLFRVTAV